MLKVLDGIYRRCKNVRPSSVSDFDFNHILVSQIDRVEILKGNKVQFTEVVHSGTINITTKSLVIKRKSFNLSNGSNSTRNIFQKSKELERSNFFISLDRFSTNGISQMVHNDEKDAIEIIL